MRPSASATGGAGAHTETFDSARLQRRVRLHALRAAAESALVEGLPMGGLIGAALGHDPARAAQQRLCRELGLVATRGTRNSASVASRGRQQLVRQALNAVTRVSRGTQIGRLLGKQASPITRIACAVWAGVSTYREASRQGLQTLARAGLKPDHSGQA